MPSHNSDQIAVYVADGNSKNDGILDSNGKVRVEFFSFLTTGKAQNDTVDLVYLPKNARILGGVLITGAMGTNVTTSIGTDLALATGSSDATTIAAGAANLLAATATAAASNTNFAATLLLGAGSKTVNGRTKVYATIGGAAPTTAIQVQGWVTYLAN